MKVIDDVKEIGDLIKKYNDIELNRKIVNLEGEVQDLTRDKRRLESKVEELAAVVEMKQNLVFKAPFWWLENDETPYCASCWENQKKAIHVVLRVDVADHISWDCPTCKHFYRVDKKDAPRQGALRPRPYGGGPNSWMGR